jgi:hypothetical protein
MLCDNEHSNVKRDCESPTWTPANGPCRFALTVNALSVSNLHYSIRSSPGKKVYCSYFLLRAHCKRFVGGFTSIGLEGENASSVCAAIR